MTNDQTETRRPWTRALRFGLVLGVVISVYSLIILILELYTNEFLELWATLVAEYCALVWFLVTTARRGNGFWQQLRDGSIAVLAMAVVFVPSSWFQLTVVAPDYADVIIEQAGEDALARGISAERVEAYKARLRPMYTPIRQTTFAFIGTLMTCLPVVVLTSIFVRKRKDRIVEP